MCPNVDAQINEEADLSAPPKIFTTNEYENMIKEQLFREEFRNKDFDYDEENNLWNKKIRALNTLVNKCVEYAEKNL